MFIKLTKLDNSPVWLNASFIVTVEPRKGGGSIVVPIGDGLDYDVREKPEEVLTLLDGAPAPQVVPIPVSDCLTKTPDDVSPEPERGQSPQPEPERGQSPQLEGGQSPAERGQSPKPETAEAEKLAEEVQVEQKSAKKTRSRAKSEKNDKTSTAKKPRATRAKKPTLDLSEEEVTRLRKMMPRSVNKLKNTLFSQFHVEDPSKTMLALEALGMLSLDRDHVIWPQVTPSESAPVDKSANN